MTVALDDFSHIQFRHVLNYFVGIMLFFRISLLQRCLREAQINSFVCENSCAVASCNWLLGAPLPGRAIGCSHEPAADCEPANAQACPRRSLDDSLPLAVNFLVLATKPKTSVCPWLLCENRGGGGREGIAS